MTPLRKVGCDIENYQHTASAELLVPTAPPRSQTALPSHSNSLISFVCYSYGRHLRGAAECGHTM
jgi:hypothetical protein